MNICICGGGSLGIVCAGVFLSQGYDVSILSGNPEKWNEAITVYDQEGHTFSGVLNKVSSDPSEVIPSADIVLLCVPGFLIETILKNVKPFLRPGTAVGSIVSSTGFFYFAHEILDPSVCLFGFQRVPFIARVKEYGRSGYLLGYKKSLNVAFENCADSESLKSTMEKMFMTPVRTLSNHHEASLTNSNPILHTGRLYSMWKDYSGEAFSEPILFYSEWTDDASEIIIRMDEEFFKLLEALHIKEGAIPSLLHYYESYDSHSLTEKIKSIPAFSSILAPMKSSENGWVPDFGSRYFTEDFPFGLHFIRELALKHDIEIPTIEKVYQWGMAKINENTL